LTFVFTKAPEKRAFKFQDTDQVRDIEKKEGQWLGQTLHSSGKNGKVVVSIWLFSFYILRIASQN